ncbi:hypothetical protein ACFE04_013307 [Oxalis oulophora]
MRVKEMHPLCCISLEESPTCSIIISNNNNNDDSPNDDDLFIPLTRARSMPATVTNSSFNDGSEDGGVVGGVLHKWTNYGKGWRSRWFTLNENDGVLSYSKIPPLPRHLHVTLIGQMSSIHTTTTNNNSINLKQICSYRESKSDDRKFYIFTATKTLHLRSDSKKDRDAWIQALVSTRTSSSSISRRRSLLNDNNITSSIASSTTTTSCLSVSTYKLKKHLLEQGVNENLVKECEHIMLSEFSLLQPQLKLLCQQRSNLLDTLRQLEAANIEAEASRNDAEYSFTKNYLSSLGRGKYSECSTTASSDDIEKRELEDVSDEDQSTFYDTKEHFTEPSVSFGSISGAAEKHKEPRNRVDNVGKMHAEIDTYPTFPNIQRRIKLPDPVEKEKGVSLWSMIKDNVGKDLSRVCLPVYFNEPTSSLQKCFEDLEYSQLLDKAYEYGKSGNSLQRILYVAAFAVSGYASSEGRHCKPFNPLLGETYEADYPEKGVRFFSEKVSHHPTILACHCEGRGWKFWGDSNLRSKFWGRSIQLDPIGELTLEFDDGEIFQWSKVTTSIYNLILGKLYCDHHGTMHISGNREYSCKLKFKEQSILDRNPHQVNGFVEDTSGKKVATLFGKWDDSMHCTYGDATIKQKDSDLSSNATLLWKSNKPPPNLTRYNLSAFSITLNELTPGLKEKLPPTDTRLRPDQRHLENGEYEKANLEKQRLERRQRMSRKLQENGWHPRWFQRKSEDGPFCYSGGYWEAREQGEWDGCLDIFGEIIEDTANCSEQEGRNSYFLVKSDVEDGLESVIFESIRLGDEQVRTTMRSVSFKTRNMEPMVSKSLSSGRLVKEGSVNFKGRDFEIMISNHLQKQSNNAYVPSVQKPEELILEVQDPNSPKHKTAEKLQKVHKSFRARRHLVDCAVLVEQNWYESHCYFKFLFPCSL